MKHNKSDIKTFFSKSFTSLVICSMLGLCSPSCKKESTNNPGESTTISIGLETSRITGVAPLSVFFDATGTTSTTSSRPFHDLEYRWDFGDNDAGFWSNGTNPNKNSKNRASGANTAHVFEKPGNYDVTLSVNDGVGVSTKKVTITVTDPEVVYASNTTCISSSGNFAGAPSGCAKVTSADFSNSLKSALAAGAKRILLKRGDSFQSTTLNILSATGPITIGAFGTGARPVITCASETASAIVSWTPKDWRVMDLEISGNNTKACGVQLSGEASDNTVLRTYIHDCGNSIMPGGERFSIVDCEILRIQPGQGIMPIYAQDIFGLFVAGNHLDSNGGGEYTMRYQGGTFGTISNNTFGRCGDHKAIFTLRGDYTQSKYVTQYHQISDNLFDASTSVGIAFIVTVNPQNSERNERIKDVVIERNKIISNPNGMNLININATDVTIRNNLLDASNIGTGPIISISYADNSAALPAPARIHIYNNSMFSNAANGITGVIIFKNGLEVLDTEVKNNFLYAPNCTHDGANNGHMANMMYDSGVGTVALNNTSDTQTKSVQPSYTAIPPVTNIDWKLAGGCYGINTGTTVPVWSDFFFTPINASEARSLGAIKN